MVAGMLYRGLFNVSNAAPDTSRSSQMRVTIELLPDGDEALARPLAAMTIANDDTGTPLNGHYDVTLTHFRRYGSIFKGTARLEDFDHERPAVDLVAAAPSVINPFKRGMASFAENEEPGTSKGKRRFDAKAGRVKIVPDFDEPRDANPT
ncbi:hypothetical protein OKW40_000682 [Paraburkholderia sp. RAU6.4a]|uniref:hypothetical protein n=1 Tax=Paraburkholderia sp. RAU6.4a TaxID=2991067 RepID=UPI003D24920E